MSVDELVKALEEQTEPHAAWKAAKEDVQKGTGTTRGKKDYTAETKGPALVDKVEDYAVDFYSAMGKGGNQNPEMLAQNLKTDLGNNYGPFRSALKIGDIDEANNIAKNAIRDKYGDARTVPIGEKILLLPPGERIAAGEKLATLAHGTDYITAATNPALVVDVLSKQKQLAESLK